MLNWGAVLNFQEIPTPTSELASGRHCIHSPVIGPVKVTPDRNTYQLTDPISEQASYHHELAGTGQSKLVVLIP